LDFIAGYGEMTLTLHNFVNGYKRYNILKPFSKTLWIVLFAVAMGYLESSVVVYLRELYYPEGFNFPLKAMSRDVAVTELYREAATLIMILAVSVLAAKIWLHRFAWFLIVFGTWDITYYLFLKILLGWPESLLTTDILFLLPIMWTGPVIAPVINSLTMILIASVILCNIKGSMPLTGLTYITWLLLIIGSLVILIAYMKDFGTFLVHSLESMPSGEINQQQFMIDLSTQFIPGTFDWWLFCSGVLMHLSAVFLIVFRKRRNSDIAHK